MLWRRVIWLSCLIAVFFVSGCASLRSKTLGYTQKGFSTKTRVFLIAGSHDSANFSQAILDQKKIWLSRDISPDEISCYYALPDEGAVYWDDEQFRALAEELSECRPAYAKLVRDHLEKVLAMNPAYVYVYITSHGSPPLWMLRQNAEATSGKEVPLDYSSVPLPHREHYQLVFSSLPSGHTFPQDTLEATANQQNLPVENLMMTPALLTSTLQGFPKVAKFVVLQGCFSGGFLEEGPIGERLIDLPNMTALTAANATQTSFGCNVGAARTFFDEFFLSSLATDAAGRPSEVDWKKLFDEVRVNVKKKGQGTDITFDSNPQFFSNGRFKNNLGR